MYKRILSIVVGLVALTGCTAQYATRCADYGYVRGTEVFAACVERQELAMTAVVLQTRPPPPTQIDIYLYRLP